MNMLPINFKSIYLVFMLLGFSGCGLAACPSPDAVGAMTTKTPPDNLFNAIVTGGEQGTYYKMGKDLKAKIHPDLCVLKSGGSYENMLRLAREQGVSFAIVQADVMQHWQDLVTTSKGDRIFGGVQNRLEMKQWLSTTRVLLPLHREEIHFVVHKNSPMRYIHDIEGKKIFMGSSRSGSYITGWNVYKLMFDKEIDEKNIIDADGNKGTDGGIDDALLRLGRLGGQVSEPPDVVILVGGQPYQAVAKLKDSKLGENFKFLTLDPSSRYYKNLENSNKYKLAQLKQQHYGILTEGKPFVNTLSVDAYLVTVALKSLSRAGFVKDFTTQYCNRFDKLVMNAGAATGDSTHAKWKEVLWKPGDAFPVNFSFGWKKLDGLDDILQQQCRKAGAENDPSGNCRLRHPTIPGRCAY